MNFEQSDILIKLSDGYIKNIIVYNDEGYLDKDNITIRKYYFSNENPIWKYYSIVKIILNNGTVQTVPLSHTVIYPANEITFAKILLNNQWIFNKMTLAEFTNFVDEVNEQKTDTAKNFRDTLIAMQLGYR